MTMVLPLAVLLLSFTSLISNLFRSSQSSPLLGLLALSDLMLSLLHLEAIHTAPPPEILARFPSEQQPWLLAQFSLTVGLHLFSLFSLITCLLAHLLLTICQPNQYQVAS